MLAWLSIFLFTFSALIILLRYIKWPAYNARLVLDDSWNCGDHENSEVVVSVSSFLPIRVFVGLFLVKRKKKKERKDKIRKEEMKRKGGVPGNQNHFEETEGVICVRNFMLGKNHLNISAWYIYIFCFVFQRLLFCYWKQTKLIVSFLNSFGWVKKVDVIGLHS